MATIFSHALFASILGKAYVAERVPLRFWVYTAICAMLPDVDAIGFAFGVPYNSLLGHRGLTHSIFFALLVGLLPGVFGFGKGTHLSKLQLSAYFALVTLSHPMLDAFTNGGLGVAWFAPFSAERYFFPWRPIEVSPIGMRFFSQRGMGVIASEVIWVWLPALAILAAALIIRHLTNRRTQAI